MKESLQLLDVVALLKDHPEAGLVACQVGTIVERLGEAVFEVEFSNEECRTYAEIALPPALAVAIRDVGAELMQLSRGNLTPWGARESMWRRSGAQDTMQVPIRQLLAIAFNSHDHRFHGQEIS